MIDGSDRRAFLTALAGGTATVAGCGSDDDDAEPTPTSAARTETETSTAELPPESDPTSVPSREVGIPQWGRRLNDHARRANIDWKQFEGDDIELTFGVALHPYATTLSATPDPSESGGPRVKDWFEELTGVSVDFEIVSDDQFWLETETALDSRDQGGYDGVMCGLWPAGSYHYGAGGNSWVRDLQQYIENDSITDRDWLAMDDFHDRTLELLTFPDEDGSHSLVGFPNTVEVYGCTALHEPTLETVGVSEPTNYDELEAAARRIAESSAVDRDGIASTTSSWPLSSANWATMFRTYGAEWIDRERRVATLDSERAVASLEQFGGMLRDYGPAEPNTYDWYASNDAYSHGRVGMLYSSPQYSGIIDESVMADTRWLPPLEGPNGQEPVTNTSIWSTAITQSTDNPEAAWLFIQWANSRQANLMLSTRQWRGDDPRAGYARFDWLAEQIADGNAPPVAGEGYLSATRQALETVPGGDPDNPGQYPPVPAETPQCMNIMSEAANAMSSVVGGDRTARDALDEAARAVESDGYLTETRLPGRYVADRFRY